MNTKAVIRSKNVLNAIYIGMLCSVAYLAVYFARNLLGAVTPEMLEGGYTEQYIDKVSSAYFVYYALPDKTTCFKYNINHHCNHVIKWCCYNALEQILSGTS